MKLVEPLLVDLIDYLVSNADTSDPVIEETLSALKDILAIIRSAG